MRSHIIKKATLQQKGLLHFYFKIRLKAGWTLKETQRQITEKLGISRAAFYSALSKLKAEGSINWSAPANTKFSISLASIPLIAMSPRLKASSPRMKTASPQS